MATANWQSEQPTNQNYLSPVNFDFQINKLPKTKWFLTGATLPSINFSEAVHSTTLAIQSYLPGDNITFDPLNITFLVDEDMTNYQEIFNWIMQLGPGMDTDDFQTLTNTKGNPKGWLSDSDYEEMYSDVFDMEAYALAKVCYKTGIDFMSFKYITDNVNEKSANDWKENCSKGIEEFKKLLKECCSK